MSLSKELSLIWESVHSKVGLPFPQTVSRLVSLGVTRYHIDYVAVTATSYVLNSSSPSISVDIAKLPAENIPNPLAATAWNKEGLVAAIRKAQAMAKEGKGDYLAFAAECIEAGVTDYVAFLDGKRVLYLGAKGDSHTEWFPGAGPSDEK
jgi:uncharacterized protein YbcV (DUF1398 family)